MIHIVTALNETSYREEMEQVFRLRHQIFVEERGWHDLAKPDGREIDQFDTPHAVHVLAIEDGEVQGYSRLLPTTRPHLLSDVLPELCEVERPSGHQIWEWSRQAISRSQRSRGKFLNPVIVSLMSGMVEWGLAHGISQFVVEVPPIYVLHLIQLHFRAQPLGLPKAISGEDVVAVAAAFDVRTLARLNQLRGTTASALAPSYTYLAA